MRRRGNNVFGIPIEDSHVLEPVELAAPSIAEELTARCGARVRHTPGCDVNSSSHAGFADAVALAAGCDVAVMVMGDKSGLTDDCTSGESRDVASLDLPGRAGGSRPRRARDRHAGGARARRRAPDRERRVARAVRRGADGMAPRPGRRGGDRRRADRRRQPGWQAADHVSAFGGAGPHVLRAQAVRRAVALEGRLRRLAGGAAVPVRPRVDLHLVRARRCDGLAGRGRRGTARSRRR